MRLPHDAVRGIGLGLGAVAHSIDRRHRAIALANLSHAIPSLDARQRHRTVHQCYRHLGAAFCEAFSASRFSQSELERRFRFEGWQHVEAALAPGKGILFIGGHFASWQIATYPLSARLGGLHVVVRPPDNPYVARDAVRMREKFGVQVLQRKGVGHRLVNLLRRGGRVGLVIDQRPPPQTGITVPFLGRPARTSELPAIAAIQTETPAIPTLCWHAGGGEYVLRFRPAIDPQPRGPGAAERLMRHYLDAISLDILERPQYWFWMHDRWKPGETAEDKMRALREARGADH
jgi:KDO2-lipid IV(A) lauroyltransferase